MELFGAKVELIAGAGGVFVITIDGKQAFSKASADRFPTSEDLAKLG